MYSGRASPSHNYNFGRRVGSRFAIALPEVHWVTLARAAAKDTVTQPVHRLNLKDSRHGHLNQNHIFSVYFPVNIVK